MGISFVLGRNCRRLIYDCFVPVIAEPLMASRQTVSAGFRFRKSYRELPFCKGYLVSNMFRVVRGMRIVARPACASFHKFIDMDKMQVPVAVSEIRQRFGCFIFGNGLFMTHEAKLVIIRVIARVEEFREILAQHPEVPGSMGVVTTRAIALFNGSVVVGIVRQNRLHVRDRTVLTAIFPIMAA